MSNTNIEDNQIPSEQVTPETSLEKGVDHTAMAPAPSVTSGMVSTRLPVVTLPSDEDEEVSVRADNTFKSDHSRNEFLGSSADAAQGALSTEQVQSTIAPAEHCNGEAGRQTPTVNVSPVEDMPLIVTAVPTESSSSLPNPPPSIPVDVNSPMSRSTSNEPISNDPLPAKANEYIRSPEVQNAIVERSPGGRYVRFMEKLGSGASKDVYRAYDTQEGIEVAWNVVSLIGVPKNERNRIVNEVRLLERLHHHNIISFHGSWVNRERQEVNFVTEILSSGTLKSFINKVQVIRWKIAKRWAVQILQGLEYLHAQEPPVIHRDLKCDNIFINGTSGDLRIGDLGLSTVHRNGKVLSVLGTPEFMAPDMYEDKPYDEKVDIYAFGMVMLEIFTKEIPYSECKNPAQIYKKVSSGEPPEVLSRLQSRHAREFVKLCLGHKDEAGLYVRPSATELLQHQFLVKRSNDDDEVVVEPPLREKVIAEDLMEPSNSGDGSTSTNRIQPIGDVVRSQVSEGRLQSQIHPSGSRMVSRPRQSSLDTASGDDGDTFEEMPECETNIRKVKVLMGRGKELDEEDENEKQSDISSQAADVVIGASILPVSNPIVVQHSPAANLDLQRSNDYQAATKQYLVAAAVIEDEGQNVRPYADEILKLVVTLPVEGQTQNVQFDFHLVNDDPVKVAKEMVQELNIPQEAVLEISETISGLACSARMKQDRYHVMMQTVLNHGQMQGQQVEMMAPSQALPGSGREYDPTVYPHAVVQQPLQDARLTHSQSQQPIFTQPAGPYSQPVIPNDAYLDYSVVSPPMVTTTQLSGANQVEERAQVHVPRGSFSAPQPPASLTQMDVKVPESELTKSYNEVDASVQLGQQIPEVQGTSSIHPPQVETQPMLPIATSENPQLSSGQSNISSGANTERILHLAEPHAFHMSGNDHPIALNQALSPAQNFIVEKGDEDRSSVQVVANQSATTMQQAIQTHQEAVAKQTTLMTDSQAGSPATFPLRTSSSPTELDANESFSDTELDSDEEDREFQAELRQLEEDFQKNMQRAQKVFDNRMDNLQRTHIEREAQHQKTLEKHEKERAEFEKRLAQEAEQQRRRLEQLQREWDKKRESLAHKRKQGPKGSNNGIKEANEGQATLPARLAKPSEHQRSVSVASSAQSVSPATSEHKTSTDSTTLVDR